VRDLLRGLPFNDNTFDEIRAHHCLEHIPAGEDLIFVMSELCRVLKPGGILDISVPHSSSFDAFCPDHRSYWNERMVLALVSNPYHGGNRMRYDIVSLKRDNTDLLIQLRKNDKDRP